MLAYRFFGLPVIERHGVMLTKFSSRFAQSLKPRLEKAAKRSGVAFELEEDLEVDGTLILFVETGKEEDFWKAFK